MSYIYKFHLPVTHPENKNNFLKIVMSFNKETIHWATSQPKEKGYQITVIPIIKSGYITEQGAFTGFYEIIYAVERQSDKRKKEAIRRIGENLDRYVKFFTDKGFVVDQKEVERYKRIIKNG